MNSTESLGQYELLQDAIELIALDDCPDEFRKEVLAIIGEEIPVKSKLKKLLPVFENYCLNNG